MPSTDKIANRSDDEAHTCTPFLERQSEVVRPRVLVALGSDGANLSAGHARIQRRHARPHQRLPRFRTVVTYNPASSRDPTPKKETGKDLQMAMLALE